MENFNKIRSELLLLILLIFMGNIYISLIPIGYLPDNEAISNSLNKHFDERLSITPQYLTLIILKNFSYHLLDLKISDFSRYVFYLINIFLIICLLLIDYFLDRGKYIQKKSMKNKIFLLSLLYPTAVISFTTPSSESVYSCLSIFLVSRFLDHKMNYQSIAYYFILFLYAFFLDRGNFILFLLFIIFITFFYLIRIKLNYFRMLILSIFLIITAKYLSFHLIKIAGIIFNISNDLQTIESINLLGLNEVNFIDTIKRYFYFWLSLMGIITHHKNIIFSIIPFVFVILYMIIKNFLKNKVEILNIFNLSKVRIVVFTFLVFPLVVISIIPTHAYGKYYLFFFPIIIKFILNYIEIYNLTKILFAITFFSVLQQSIFFT